MGETENKAAQKESFFSGLSAEFKKIIWPDNKSLARQTSSRCCCFRSNGSCDRASGFCDSVWR